jgi:hypothetical protein
VGSFIVLYPAIVSFGIKGIIAVCIIEAVVYRLYLRRLASRERKVPFQDHVAVFGCFAIFAEIVYVHWAVPALALQLVLTAASLAMPFVIGRRSISEMISVGRQIVLGRPARGYSPLRAPYPNSRLTGNFQGLQTNSTGWCAPSG